MADHAKGALSFHISRISKVKQEGNQQCYIAINQAHVQYLYHDERMKWDQNNMLSRKTKQKMNIHPYSKEIIY